MTAANKICKLFSLKIFALRLGQGVCCLLAFKLCNFCSLSSHNRHKWMVIHLFKRNIKNYGLLHNVVIKINYLKKFTCFTITLKFLLWTLYFFRHFKIKKRRLNKKFLNWNEISKHLSQLGKQSLIVVTKAFNFQFMTKLLSQSWTKLPVVDFIIRIGDAHIDLSI